MKLSPSVSFFGFDKQIEFSTHLLSKIGSGNPTVSCLLLTFALFLLFSIFDVLHIFDVINRCILWCKTLTKTKLISEVIKKLRKLVPFYYHTFWKCKQTAVSAILSFFQYGDCNLQNLKSHVQVVTKIFKPWKGNCCSFLQSPYLRFYIWHVRMPEFVLRTAALHATYIFFKSKLNELKIL